MDFYSRLIAFLKVLLPLAALAILATLFLLSRNDDLTTTIPFAEGEIATRTRDQQVTAPFFSGTTPKGEEINVTADLARPGGQGEPAEATNLNARIKLVDGKVITLVSESGSVNPVSDMATFTGNVRIVSTTGIIILTDELNTALRGIEGNTPGPVSGSGPIGEFTAGQLHISSQNEQGAVHMLFKNGVNLIYDPKQSER